MSVSVLHRRAFQRTNKVDDEELARRFFYARLMQVEIFHDYYNADGRRCPVFDVQPTATTTTLMARLGLLFRAEPYGFSVLYDTKRKNALLRFILRREEDILNNRVEGWWKRLSFMLTPRDDTFINFTRVPLETNSLDENFFLSNYRIPLEDGVADDEPPSAYLREGGGLSRFSDVSVADEIRVIPAKFYERFPLGAERIVVRGISTAEMQCYPRCLDPEAVRRKGLDNVTCDDALSREEGGECRPGVYLNLSLLPMDRYTIAFESAGGEEIGTSFDALYVASKPTPLCFVDLFLAPPHVDTPGDYPVVWQPAPHIPSGVRYEISFRNRSTMWRYFAVPREGEIEAYKNLKIACTTVADRPTGRSPCAQRQFGRGVPVPIASGQIAMRFDSQSEIPLQQRYDFRLSVEGTLRSTGKKVVLVERLPTPSTLQVGPAETSTRPPDERARALIPERLALLGVERPENTSDIYVYF